MDVDTSNFVSWQSAYWGLVPLAISVMAQPSGQTCGFNLRWRFYLRSSPIVCLADFIGLVLRFTIFMCGDYSFPRAMERTIDSRELQVEADPVGGQAIERAPVLRFILFALAVTQAVKLLSCTGIPWTQTWAYSYLIPFCAYEILGIFGKWVKATTHQPRNALDRMDRRLEEALSSLDNILGFLAIAAQWLTIAYIIGLIMHAAIEPDFSSLAYRLLRFGNSITLGSFTAFPVVVIGAVIAAVIAILVKEVWPQLGLYGPYYTLASVICLPSLYFVNSRYVFEMSLDGPMLIFGTSLVLLSISFGLCFGFGWILLRVSKFFRVEVFLLIAGDPTRGERRIAVHNFLFFLHLFVFGLLGYAFRFDPRGTFQPNLTKVFG
jgi:hypothetical protein